MKLLQKNNMLLFSKEYKTADYKYILYFVQVESIWSDRPRIHRLVAVSKKQFMQFQIGFTYALELNKFKISQFTKEGEFELANSDYLRLIEARDIKFMDQKAAANLRKIMDGRDISSVYYSIDDMKKLLNFKTSKGWSLLTGFVLRLLLLLSIFLPLIMYLLYIYSCTVWYYDAASESFLGALSLPILAICAFPFAICLMYIFNIYTELLLMQVPIFKLKILQRHVLLHGGLKKSTILTPRTKKKMRKWFFICLGIFGASLIYLILITIF